MATYLEIRSLFNDRELRFKVSTAVIIAAGNILNEVTPSVARKAWAGQAFRDPETEAKRVLSAVLAANKTATLPQISGASDAAIQANVDDAVALFIDVDAGV